MDSFFTDILILLTGIECPVHHFLHIYCPGCGSTRSFLSLVRGDVLMSLHYNPIVIMAIFFAASCGVLLALEKSGKITMETKKKGFKMATIVILSFWVLFFLVRNIALVAFGADWIGDFS